MGAISGVILGIFPVIRGDERISNRVPVRGRNGILVSDFRAVTELRFEFLFVFEIDGRKRGTVGKKCDIGIDPKQFFPIKPERKLKAIEIDEWRSRSNGRGIGRAVVSGAALALQIVQSKASSAFNFERQRLVIKCESRRGMFSVEFVKCQRRFRHPDDECHH